MEAKNNRDSFDRKMYETFTFNTNSVQLRRLPFELFFVAISKFSGPIAMYLNKLMPTDISFSQEDSDYLLLFSTKGTIFNRIPFHTKDKIIAFEFTADEVLIIGTTTAYYLVDPYRSSIKMLDLSDTLKRQRIMGYRIANSRLYVFAGKRVFEIRSIHQPLPKELAVLNIHADDPVMIIQPGKDDFEVIYLHQRRQIYSSKTGNQVLECEHLADPKNRLVYLNKHQESLSTYYLMIFHNPFRIGYFVNGSSTYYEPPQVKIVEESTQKKTGSSRRQPGTLSDRGYSCGWVEDTAYISNKLWVIRLNSRGLNFLKNQQTLISEQIDGIRLYGENSQIVRLVPPEYLAMFKQSNDPGISPMYQAFQQYQSNNVVNIQLLKSPTQDAEQTQSRVSSALQSVVKAAGFCLDPIQQMRILKFGIFFKTYYCVKTNLNQLCGSLRLINNLKHQVVNRCLTLREFQFLKQNRLESFVTILLRYNLHYMADLVGGGQRVYFHWAKCKIEKEREDIALNSIVEKFNAFKEKEGKALPYVEIARYAIQTKRFQLAQKLIEYEPNIKKRVMILLWMAALKKQSVYLERALENADKSADDDTIFRVIFEVEKENISSDVIQKLIDKRPILQSHYVQYLRQINPNKLKDYYAKKKMTYEFGLLALKAYLGNQRTPESFNVVKKFLPSVADSQSTPKTAEYALFLKKALHPQYVITQGEIDRFKSHKNPEYLIEVLVQRGMVDEAVSVLYSISSDLSYELLIKMDKWSQVTALAKQRKDQPMLQKLLERAPSQSRQSVLSALDQLKPK